MMPMIADEIERYLRTGESDPYHAAWSGGFFERAKRAHDDLRNGLVCFVKRLAEGREHAAVPESDVVSLTRARVEPMVRGFFPQSERQAVLGRLEQSVIFVSSANIGRLLIEQSFDHSAWMLANLYLASVGANLLAKDAPHLVGISEENTCCISAEYFTESNPFADFIVDEAAHVFHNCKRCRACRKPKSEWLLDIEHQKRETFAYACEAYSCVLQRGKHCVERRALAEEYGRQVSVSDERVHAVEVATIVQAATAAHNGWKVILEYCAPVRHGRADTTKKASSVDH